MTVEQAGALVVIALFAVFIIWGRTKSGQDSVRRLFGSRRDPDPPTKQPRKSSSSGRKRSSSRRGRAR